jgi:hypothetical protein
LTNIVTLKTNIDVYLTGFECVGGFPQNSNNNCKFVFNEETDSFETQPRICLEPRDSNLYHVRIAPSYYEKGPTIVRSVQTKFGYHKILKRAQFMPKDVTITLKIVMECRQIISIQHIKENTVNQLLKAKDSYTDFDLLEVKCYKENHYFRDAGPIFVKSIRFFKR